MAISSLSTQYISASFQNLAQISASGELFNGNGTQITNLILTSVTASVYGVISNATSASYVSWSYVDVTTDSIFPGTASYYQETEPIFTSVSASLVTTSSYNSASSSFSSRITTLETVDLNINSVTASLVTTSSLNSFTASYNSSSSSFSSRITTLETVDLNINSVTASLVTTSSLNSFTASYNSASSSFSSRITTLEAVDLNLNSLTASLATTGSNTFKSTQTISGSVLISGSIIPNVNGVSTTSSFSLGSPTAAWKDIWVANGTINFINEAGTIQSSLSATSAGLVISGAVVTTNQSSLTGSLLGSASYALTASYALNGGGVSTDTGSLLVTASVSSNTITFTKGDGSTFPITVATGSVTPAAFPFTGSAEISGSLTVTGLIRFQPSSSILTAGTYFINGLVPGCMYICDASAGNVGIELYPISSSNARYEFLVSSTDFGSYALKLFNHISSFASLFDYTQATNVGSYVSVYYYASSSAIAYGNLDS